MRLLTSFIWVFVTLAFGLDAVAQPCDLRADVRSEMHTMSAAEMPCHDAMEQAEPADPAGHSEHQQDICCCAALLTNIVVLSAVDLDQPLPGMTSWATPLPDNANSIPFEYEPPPPRA